MLEAASSTSTGRRGEGVEAGFRLLFLLLLPPGVGGGSGEGEEEAEEEVEVLGSWDRSSSFCFFE
jgi:hypothetical protein